jgi:hypothetical protein
MVINFLIMVAPAALIFCAGELDIRARRRRQIHDRMVHAIEGCMTLNLALTRSASVPIRSASAPIRRKPLGALTPMPTKRIVAAPRLPTTSPRQPGLVTFCAIGKRDTPPVPVPRRSLAIHVVPSRAVAG